VKRPPSKRDFNQVSPVLAVNALALAGLLALVEAERFWIGYVPTAEIPLLLPIAADRHRNLTDPLGVSHHGRQSDGHRKSSPDRQSGDVTSGSPAHAQKGRLLGRTLP
jgi:hypothetical protein